VALAAWKHTLEGAAALVYTPSKCRLYLVRAGILSDEADAACDTSPYEARIFNEQGELRWLCTPALDERKGRAVYLTEDAAASPSIDSREWRAGECLQCQRWDNHYAVWGAPTGAEPSGSAWSCLADPRIGSLFVPLAAITGKRRVRLCSYEYVGRDPGPAGDHGNVAVIEERFLAFEPFDLPKPPKRTER
jgi:CRISPR-associated protein (TIGR03984 family)